MEPLSRSLSIAFVRGRAQAIGATLVWFCIAEQDSAGRIVIDCKDAKLPISYFSEDLDETCSPTFSCKAFLIAKS